ncbi:MAG: adenosylmethionine decarboxylase [Candidatus Nezhaarchaeota archaeon]|nr:adenosylmethionine decarboxylase [Candidatus Nezhaarchaeota archaeon]MCX8142099.1 adenosylmethionine decarboxylase [Candidatus Nezhaarchaeota archaeon]MDW8050120.1 adenosylmethionine decarboxylase [Nitrososphaerota archaeon]
MELGRHIIIELYSCPPNLINDEAFIKNVMIEAVKVANGNVCGAFFHKFNPQGLTGVVIISESHISIHTWPEYGYAAVDVFTCGERMDPWKAYNYIVKNLKPSNVNVLEIKRGLIPRVKH